MRRPMASSRSPNGPTSSGLIPSGSPGTNRPPSYTNVPSFIHHLLILVRHRFSAQSLAAERSLSQSPPVGRRRCLAELERPILPRPTDLVLRRLQILGGLRSAEEDPLRLSAAQVPQEYPGHRRRQLSIFHP